MAKEEKKKAKKFEPNKRQAALNERQQTKIRYLKKTEQDDRVRALTRAFTQKNKEAEIMSDKQKARVEYLKKQGREDDALKVRNKARVAAGLKKVKPKPKPVTDSSGRVQTGRDRADAESTVVTEMGGYKNPDPSNPTTKAAKDVLDTSDSSSSGSKSAQEQILSKPLKPPSKDVAKNPIKKPFKPWSW